jgi:hypothetical protein
LFEELEVTKRKDVKSAHKKRMAKEMRKVPAQAVATASKNKVQERTTTQSLVTFPLKAGMFSCV